MFELIASGITHYIKWNCYLLCLWTCGCPLNLHRQIPKYYACEDTTLAGIKHSIIGNYQLYGIVICNKEKELPK